MCWGGAQEFLEQGSYKTPEECQKAGVKKQSFNVFERRLGREKPVLYHLTDKAPPKGHKDWKRVVAIFTTGQLWQFKDYPTDIFRASPLTEALSYRIPHCGSSSAVLHTRTLGISGDYVLPCASSSLV